MRADKWTRVIALCLIVTFPVATGLGQESPEAPGESEEVVQAATPVPLPEAEQATPPPSEPPREEPAATPAVEKPEAPAEAEEAVLPEPLPPEEEEAPAALAAEEQPTAPGHVTFDFKDADITNILRIFSKRYGVNIVAGPDVKGTVTIRLVDVPWETALRLILQVNNFTYVKEENVIRIISREQAEKEPLQTKVYPLSYATAGEVVNSITQLLTANRGQIKADTRSNTLVVTDVPAILDQIGRIIERLDKRTPQVLIEARILELTDDFDENIGINWIALKGYNVSFGPPEGKGFFEIQREKVKTKDDTTEATAIDRDIYRRERQSGVGKFGTDDTFGSTEEMGTTVQTIISTVEGEKPGTTIITKTPQHIEQDISGRIFEDYYKEESIDKRGAQVTTTELTQAVLTPDNFQLTLNFLQEQSDANLISHPKLVTANNKESVMKVATEWPIPEFQFNDDTGQWEVSGFDWKDIGVILTVTPHVNEDDYINIKVSPVVSTILGTTTFSGATGAEIPIISTRTAETEVLVKNGDTLAIGGLMRENEISLVNKVPLFGDIPLVGPYLFSFSRKEIEKSNILIFVTASIIDEENKDALWISQRQDQQRRLNIPGTKWWEPKKFRYGLGSEAGY